MASKRRLRRKACGKKIRYTTVKDAENAKFRVYRQSYSGPMDVYHCSFCGGYHFGHSKHGRKPLSILPHR
jgi:hypothetical protein